MSDFGDILPYLLILAALVSASAFFSGTEVAMFSLRRVDREKLAASDRKNDSLVLRLLARPRRLITTLLIGNELVNISLSVVVASLVPQLWPGRGELELALIGIAVALPLLLLLGEITPKTVAFKTSMGWSRKSVRLLWLFAFLVAPLRVIVRFIADQIMRPFGGASNVGPRDMTEEEFKALVDAGSAGGALKAEERRFIHRVFEFGEKTAAQVMQPRKQIYALAYDLPTVRLIKEIADGGYSRVPIYQKSMDRIIGIVYAKDLVVQGTGLSAPRRLVDLLHEPLFVPPTIPLERLFRIFKTRKTHMALVVNEYGKVVGLVTMEDLLEELFGEIYDEREQQKASVKLSIRLTTEPGIPTAEFEKVLSMDVTPSDSATGDGEGNT